MRRDFTSAAVGHDANRAIGQIPQQSGDRFLHVKDDGEVIGRIDAIDEAVDRRLGAANLALKQGIERPLHVARGERTSIMKLHAVMQMKDVGERIGNLPALGQSGRDIQIVAAREQVVEDQIVDALRLRVDSHARIEIRRARFDQHHQRVGIGLAGAGEQRYRSEGGRSCEGCENEEARRISGSPAHLVEGVDGSPVAGGGDTTDRTRSTGLLHQTASGNSIGKIEINLLAKTAGLIGGVESAPPTVFRAAAAGASDRKVTWSFSGSIPRCFRNGLRCNRSAISSAVLEMTETEKPKSPRILSSILFDNAVGRNLSGFEDHVSALNIGFAPARIPALSNDRRSLSILIRLCPPTLIPRSIEM